MNECSNILIESINFEQNHLINKTIEFNNKITIIRERMHSAISKVENLACRENLENFTLDAENPSKTHKNQNIEISKNKIKNNVENILLNCYAIKDQLLNLKDSF